MHIHKFRAMTYEELRRFLHPFDPELPLGLLLDGEVPLKHEDPPQSIREVIEATSHRGDDEPVLLSSPCGASASMASSTPCLPRSTRGSPRILPSRTSSTEGAELCEGTPP